MTRTTVLRGLCVGALGCLLTAAPAPAHRLEVPRAVDAVREAAQAVGEVEHVDCWRGAAQGRRARHNAFCVAWWVRTPARESCALFYDVRLAAHPSRRLTVIQTHDPWCASLPAAEWM